MRRIQSFSVKIRGNMSGNREETDVKKLMKKAAKLLLVLVGIIVTAIVGLEVYFRLPQDDPSGILLGFDDYYEENWEQHFDLFEEYDVKATFFVNLGAPTDFCRKAIERGHEIGFHTMEHVDLTQASEAELLEQAIVPIEEFKEAGIELTSFAYPYGAYTEETNQKLLKHYNIVRGAWYYELRSKEDLKSGFVEAKPIDNISYQSELQFRWVVCKMLYEAKLNEGTVVPIYSHGIESGDYCITPERLEYILKLAKKLKLEFYTYNELQ